MKVLKFTLSGRTAFFKKPDVNSFYYFTYGNIHKVALLGILGSIMGYGGYNQQKNNKEQIYPEFYQKLKSLKLGIVPKNQKGYIPKKIQVFNNSVGYASQEKGGNLIVKEQWLENPKWDIYILLENEISFTLAKRMVQKKFQYIPYLGKNDHPANIMKIEIIEDAEKQANPYKLDSLFIKDYAEFQTVKDDVFDMHAEYIDEFKYEEMLPISLEENTNKYRFKSFVFTNSQIIPETDLWAYRCNNDIISFF